MPVERFEEKMVNKKTSKSSFY